MQRVRRGYVTLCFSSEEIVSHFGGSFVSRWPWGEGRIIWWLYPVRETFKNRTVVKEFWILGFENAHNFRVLLFLLFLVNYIVTCSANFMIVLLVCASHHIYSPMYFFLSHLSLNDILLTTNIVPQMLSVVLREGSAMSIAGCFTQFYFFEISATTECLLLTVMSYDRYLAICNPLRYSSIMDLKLCVYLVTLTWVCGLVFSLAHIVFFTRLIFCGSNVINHFFCDMVPLLKLSCSDISGNEMVNFVLSIPILFFPLVCITLTYTNILISILRISTTTGRQKAFSTCSSHLTVVCIYYGTLVFNYVIPSKGKYLSLQKQVSVLYTMVTPLLNPIIYSLRNEEIRGSLNRFIFNRKGGTFQT
ncbi:olfactory receptor 1009-like [Spea bombifrons]|uniref:olfactory receptor 1009-like n=1 Tax=Spea bombifrons TaxID=233779 RepID=UPI00234A4FB2|nr:olfactory receptor 1009-like [Spea bombifrons]